MRLERLTVDAVRNLSQQRIHLGSGANVFFGLNGSGKTSILEAVHLLGLGRSFRTHSARPLIQHGREECLVQAQAVAGGRGRALGVRRYRSGGADLRLDGRATQSVAELARALPLVVLDTDSMDLIAGPPDARRKYLDTFLFHVEQGFMDVWRRYQRVLRQRNACLRRGTLDEASAWTGELSRAGQNLADMRRRAAEALAESFHELAGSLSEALAGAEFVFRQGWEQGKSLDDVLARGLESDLSRGFTQAGPHRCDVRVLVDRRPAADVMSRGQMKLAAIAMKLAQARLILRQRGEPPLCLVDDITAELDVGHAARVCEILRAVGGQVLLTSVKQDEIPALWPGPDLTMFHVEHGVITRVAEGPAPSAVNRQD